MPHAARWARSAVLVAAAFTGGAFASRLASADGKSPYAPFDQIARVLVLVENQYVDPADRTKVIEGAIKGMVAELDPHSAYMNASDYALFQGETEGHFGGIGVEVDFKNDLVTVLAPIEGAPAERAGIRPGDQIVSINGHVTRGERLEKLVTLMRGPPGSTARVIVRRTGVADPIVFDLAREEIHVTSVVAQRLRGDVGYVRVKQFQEGTHGELLRAAAKLKGESPRPLSAVILDLRNDPGGLVDEAQAVADEFLPSGVIYTTRHRGKIVEEVRAHDGGAFASVPIVALVNEYSASSAELVAGALQDNKRATVVGATTFGKGSVQTIFDLPGGAGMRLTTMRYYTPSGRSIQAEGIRPDIVIQSPPVSAANEPVRERDLDGHLAAESEPTAGGHKSVVVKDPSKVAAEGPMLVGAVPVDPEAGSDFALLVGYRFLMGKGEKP